MLLTDARRPARTRPDGDAGAAGRAGPDALGRRRDRRGRRADRGPTLADRAARALPAAGRDRRRARRGAPRARTPTGRRSSGSTTCCGAVAPGPMVTLNRIVALAMVDGPAAGLAALDARRPGSATTTGCTPYAPTCWNWPATAMPRVRSTHWPPAARSAGPNSAIWNRGPPGWMPPPGASRASVGEVTEPTPRDLPRTVGELRAAGHEYRTVKEELRDNLLARMRAGEPRFPGIVGFDDTVLPEVERALLAGHDMVLLGERGQGKTRLIRSLVAAARRVDAGDRPAPSSTSTRCTRSPRRPARLAAEARRRPAGRLAAPLDAVRREAGHPGHQRRRPDRRRRPDPGRRRAAPSATRRPSTSGWCRAPTAASSPSTSCPTWPSGSRCRCSTCWRSATSRSAATSCGCRWTCCWWPAPTRRTTPTAGRIITPLKDRFGAEIRTHYPLDLELEIDLIRQEADAGRRRCPSTCSRCWPGSPAAVRESPAVDARSGVSARFADRRRRDGRRVRAAPRRAARRDRGGRPGRRHRVGDQHAARQGRVRERRGGPGDRGPRPPAAHRDRRDVPGPAGRAGPVRLHRPGRRGRHRSRPASWSRADELLRQVGTVPGLAKVLDRLGLGDAPDPRARRRPASSSCWRACT